jgi:hypothetical protein
MTIHGFRIRAGLAAWCLLCASVFYCGRAQAQQTARLTVAAGEANGATLPDAPTPWQGQMQTQSASDSGARQTAERPAATPVQTQGKTADKAQDKNQDDEEGKQTKRILGVMPNFKSVSVNSHPPPQSTREKFKGFTDDSFDYSSFILVGLIAGTSQIQGSDPEFHSGPAAFGRYYWRSFVDQTDENLWVDFLLPVPLHEDARYYTMGRFGGGKHNSVVKRVGYSMSRILITRTDSGKSSFNFAEVVGSGASSGLSNLYYPASDRDWTKTGQRWALNLGIDGISFVAREFWPDIRRVLNHL